MKIVNKTVRAADGAEEAENLTFDEARKLVAEISRFNRMDSGAFPKFGVVKVRAGRSLPHWARASQSPADTKQSATAIYPRPWAATVKGVQIGCEWLTWKQFDTLASQL